MRKTSILFILTFLTFNVFVKSQTIQITDSIWNFEKAKYPKEDLSKFLYDNVKFPKEGIMNDIQGDVIVSFVITKNGKLDSLSIISSPDISYSTSSIVALNSLNSEWIPSKVNGYTIDKKYQIIFRYRIFLETDYQAAEHINEADKYFETQKYSKSLKIYNRVIKDNPYDYKLFESRSKTKEKLGDIKGAEEDRKASVKIDSEIMSVVNVIVIGIIRR